MSPKRPGNSNKAPREGAADQEAEGAREVVVVDEKTGNEDQAHNPHDDDDAPNFVHKSQRHRHNDDHAVKKVPAVREKTLWSVRGTRRGEKKGGSLFIA